jgi:hypothetical protein
MEKEISANSRASYLQQFLGSNAYNKAAHATATSALKLGCYSALSAMSSVYPFKPKEVGFQKVTKLLAPDLSHHRWDQEADQLVSPCGDVLVVPEDCFPNLTNPVVKHPWSETRAPWLFDMYDDKDSDGVGEQASSEERTEIDELVKQRTADGPVIREERTLGGGGSVED